MLGPRVADPPPTPCLRFQSCAMRRSFAPSQRPFSGLLPLPVAVQPALLPAQPAPLPAQQALLPAQPAPLPTQPPSPSVPPSVTRQPLVPAFGQAAKVPRFSSPMARLASPRSGLSSPLAQQSSPLVARHCSPGHQSPSGRQPMAVLASLPPQGSQLNQATDFR